MTLRTSYFGNNVAATLPIGYATLQLYRKLFVENVFVCWVIVADITVFRESTFVIY